MRPYRGDKSVGRTVCDTHGVFFGIKRDDCLNRTKNFVLGQWIIRVYPSVKSRCKVMSTIRCARNHRRLRHNSRGAGMPDKTLDDFFLARGNQRSDIQIIHSGANFHCAVSFSHHFRQFIVNTALHQNTRRSRAGLACVLHPCVNQKRYRRIKISIVKHDLWRFSTKFQSNRHNGIRRRFLDQRSDTNGSGKGNVVDIRMGRQRHASLFAQTGHYVQCTGRQAGLLCYFCKSKCSQTGFFRRF